ncbi:relaxase/mobilization nuclease domain-containing protein [Roseburia intestinalis]
MAITKILNIKESEGRNPASHLKNALEYIQNPDKTEECVLVGGINCLPDTAFEQMEETKNIFHKTGKRQGYHVIISFSPEEKVTAEQAMYVLEHFAKDVLGDDYEVVYAVHTDREHMHGHLIWNSVSMTTGKKYNSPKSNWKNHLQPITNKYCDELGLSIMPAEYSRNPKNISRDKWEREMSMKEIILRDAKMCAYAAGNVEHFKYLMKRLGYVFKKDAWMEVQAPGFRYYHKLAKLDEMFSEDMLRHYVDMPWMSKPYFYSSDIRGLHRAKLSPYQKRFYSKLYRLRIVEQKRFIVGGAKYTEDLKRFHRLQDEYLLLVNNDIKSVVDLVDFISEQEEKIQQIEDRQHEIYRESSSRKRNIKTEAQYRKYQIWHVEVQEKLDELKQEKRKIKRQLQLADDIIKEDLYTAYYAVSGKEEIVADRDVEIPGMEEDMLVERTAGAVVESERNVVVMNQPANSHNDGNGQEEQINVAGKQQIDLEGTEMSKVHNLSDENVTRMDEGITDVTGKSELVEHEEKEPVDKAGWIVRRISELGGYENVSDSVKADIFGFDIADVSGSIRLFSDVMKKLGIKLDGDGLYEEFQRIYDEAVNRDVDKGKAEDKTWNKGRGR